MNKPLFPKNYYPINITPDIKAICEPLKLYGITFCAYIRCYDNGSMYLLNTWNEFVFYHFQKQYRLAPYISENMLADSFFYLALAENTDAGYNKQSDDIANMFKFINPLYLIDRYKGYVDIMIYVGNVDNPELINSYMNNMDILKSFKTCFRNKAAKIMQKADNHRMILPDHMRLNFKGITQKDEATNAIDFIKEKAGAINQILQLHYKTKLTVRELQTLNYLLKGRTAFETAQILHISPKTVEFYIDSVKLKLNCLNKADLFDKIWNTNLINVISQI